MNLEYLANLLEDASDFLFANAKACHAVVLTTMEADKLEWKDTEQLDRLRRQHAQKHPSPANSNTNQTTSKNKISEICRVSPAYNAENATVSQDAQPVW